MATPLRRRHILLCVAGLTPQTITETLYALTQQRVCMDKFASSSPSSRHARSPCGRNVRACAALRTGI
jgi:hypothetical protein